jgi:hypothetical protein
VIFYDRLRDKRDPVGDFWRAEEGLVLRAAYDHTGPLSYLSAVHLSDGVHLHMWARPDFQQNTITDRRMHHVNRLTDRVEEYAALFSTKKFIVETKRPPALLARLLPAWTQIGYVPSGAYRIEYSLP